MQFLYPQFLWALTALSIPIIIHLFNFRRYKKIFFTNVRFLQNIEQEHRSRNKLRHLLLLLLRLLALASIIFAFAYPYVPQSNTQIAPGKKYISIYLDNSFSMSNVGPEGELFELGKRQARRIAEQFNEGDGFQLLTNDFELRHQRWVSRQEFIQLLEDVSITPSTRTVAEVYSRMRENFREAETANRLAYFISDLQVNMLSEESTIAETDIQTVVIPLKAAVESNVYIDSLWFDNPIWQVGQSNVLMVNIVNSSENNLADGNISLKINGQQKAISNFSAPATGETSVELQFTVTDEGDNKAVVEINDYPITFDDQMYFSFDVRKDIPILVVNGNKENTYITRAFAAESAFKVEKVTLANIDYTSFNKYSFIVLNELRSISSGMGEAIKNFMEAGGNVLTVPPGEAAESDAYNGFLGSLNSYRMGAPVAQTVKLLPIDASQPFFSNIFDEFPRNVAMPVIERYYSLSSGSFSRGNVLLSLANGAPFLTLTPVGAGNFYFIAGPLQEEWGGFINHSLFLPALYKMALYKGQAEKLYSIIGKDNYIKVPSFAEEKENVVKLTKDSLELIPPQRVIQNQLNLFVEGLIPDAGFYTLGSATGDRNIYAFNYSREESEMKFLSEEEIKAAFGENSLAVLDANEAGLQHQIREVEEGVQLWKWFIVSALVFLLAETLLIRFWK